VRPHPQPALRVLPAAWLLLALLLRTFAPPGYMAGTDARGAPALVLCPGVTAAAGPHHHHRHSQSDPAQHRESPCPSAALAAPALPPAPSLLAAPAPVPAPPPVPGFVRAAPTLALAAPPPPATGPPSFA
jgi:hypothetical protein